MESSEKAIARLDYGIKKYEEQIKRLREFQKIYKGTKVEEKLEEEIKKFEGIIQDLENLKPTVIARSIKSEETKKSQKPGKIVQVVSESIGIDEQVSEKLDESAKTAEESQKTTIDILQKISEDLEEGRMPSVNVILGNRRISLLSDLYMGIWTEAYDAKFPAVI